MLEVIAIATLIGAVAADQAEEPPRTSGLDLALQHLEQLKQRIVQAHGEQLDPDQDFYLADWSVPDEVIEWWNTTTNTRWLDTGTNRIAVRIPDGRVLKLALDPDGRASNLAELETWNSAQSDRQVLDFLVPIHAGNEHFILMDYAKPLGLELPDALDRRFRQRNQKWGDLLFQGRSRARDVPYFNWGIHQGRIRLLDYEAHP